MLIVLKKLICKKKGFYKTFFIDFNPLTTYSTFTTYLLIYDLPIIHGGPYNIKQTFFRTFWSILCIASPFICFL